MPARYVSVTQEDGGSGSGGEEGGSSVLLGDGQVDPKIPPGEISFFFEGPVK
jgi:hypothetical protein